MLADMTSYAIRVKQGNNYGLRLSANKRERASIAAQLGL